VAVSNGGNAQRAEVRIEVTEHRVNDVIARLDRVVTRLDAESFQKGGQTLSAGRRQLRGVLEWDQAVEHHDMRHSVEGVIGRWRHSPPASSRFCPMPDSNQAAEARGATQRRVYRCHRGGR
jgi:hypothetical protein